MEKIKPHHPIQVAASKRKINISPDFYLRELEEKDVDSINSLYGQSEFLKYTDEAVHSSMQESYDFIKAEKKRIDSNKGICWVIIDSRRELFTGIIRIKNIDFKNYSAIVGYYLHQDFWGMGVGSAALAAVVNESFHSLNLHRLEAQVYVKHPASIKVLEKCGFIREGRLKENFLIQGTFRDSFLYAITTSDT